MFVVVLREGGMVGFDGKPVPVGDRGIPRLVSYERPAAPGSPALELAIEVVDGLPVVTMVKLSVDLTEENADGRGCRATDVKDTASGFEALVEDVLAAATFVPDGKGGWKRGWPQPEATRRRNREGVQEARAELRRKVTPELLQLVAQTYRQAGDGGRNSAVARSFGVSERTAGRYIQLARAQGLLPATTQGKVAL